MAKRAFYERAEPPIPKLIFVDVSDLRRDLFSVVRDYARECFNGAVDALVVEGIDPARAAAVENALLRSVRAGQTSAADAILTGLVRAKPPDSRAGAATLRHSVALAELPAALANAIKSRKPFFFNSKPLPPDGEKAYPAYKHAAELDPGDPWTWIIIAILEKYNGPAEAAIRNAERTALAADDWRAAVFARQLFGQAALRSRGRFAEADLIDASALALARQKSASHPSDVASRREIARDLVWVGSQHHDAPEAGAAFDGALTIRKALVENWPDDMRAQVDLIASYAHLFQFFSKQGSKDEAKKDFDEGYRLYEATESRIGFFPQFNPLQTSSLTGVVFVVVVSAVVLTLILGLVVLALYRSRMKRLMRATAKALYKPLVTPAAGSSDGFWEIAIRSLSVVELTPTKAYRSKPILHAIAARRDAAWAYAVAACAFAATATFFYFYFTGIDVLPNRGVTVFLAWAWPAILTLNFLWGRDRRRLCLLLVIYFAVLLGVCLRVAVGGDTPPLKVYGVTLSSFMQPLAAWSLAILPTLFLFFFLNRSIRAIGAILLVFMIFIACGYMVGDSVGSMPNVRNAIISFVAALGVHSGSITFWLMPLAGIAGFVPVGWFVVRGISQCYGAKWFSDQAMIFDTIWLFQTLLLWETLFHDVGPLLALVAFAAFGSYKLVSWLGLRLSSIRARQQQPARLLLLRTFGFRGRSERFFDQLSARWRYAGPIQLIAAPDLAGHSIDPPNFLLS